VHWSVLFLAFDACFIATPAPLIVETNIAQYMVFPLPPCCIIQQCPPPLVSQVLFSPMTYVQLKPVQSEDLATYPHYDCPVYRTTARRGTLSTTGHSTNFVMFIRLPTDRLPAHWVIRGVALINSLAT